MTTTAGKDLAAWLAEYGDTDATLSLVQNLLAHLGGPFKKFAEKDAANYVSSFRNSVVGIVNMLMQDCARKLPYNKRVPDVQRLRDLPLPYNSDLLNLGILLLGVAPDSQNGMALREYAYKCLPGVCSLGDLFKRYNQIIEATNAYFKKLVEAQNNKLVEAQNK